jgi:hypothetical protein
MFLHRPRTGDGWVAGLHFIRHAARRDWMTDPASKKTICPVLSLMDDMMGRRSLHGLCAQRAAVIGLKHLLVVRQSIYGPANASNETCSVFLRG